MGQILDANGDAMKAFQEHLETAQGTPVEVEEKSSIKKIKASERTRSHLGNNDPAPFKNEEDMIAKGNEIYARHKNNEEEIYQKDKSLGLDIRDKESILAFETGYVPLFNSVLVKIIKKQEEVVSNIIILDSSNDNTQAVVMTPGLYVSTLKRGDIIALKGTKTGQLIVLDRILKGIKFAELDYEMISGIFMNEKEFRERVNNA